MLDLTGRWKVCFDRMRTHPEGAAVRVAPEGQGHMVQYHHTSTETDLAYSVAPVMLGRGMLVTSALLRLRWPFLILQSEPNVATDQGLAVGERDGKSENCKLRFTWNGERFVHRGDLL